MNTLKSEVLQRIEKINYSEIEGIYADWNLEKETGLFIAAMASDKTGKENDWPADVDQNALEKNHRDQQKNSKSTRSYRAVLVEP